jgi:hypothetical protein
MIDFGVGEWRHHAGESEESVTRHHKSHETTVRTIVIYMIARVQVRILVFFSAHLS